MPQTLLGILAIALASLLTLNSQQHQMGTYQDRLVDEYRLAAGGMATHIMEIIAARSFDEATTPLAIELRDASGSGDVMPSAGDFTRTSDFGEAKESTDLSVLLNPEVVERILDNRSNYTGFFRRYEENDAAGCDLLTHSIACDDIDDVDGLRGERVDVALSNGGTLPFSVDVDVFYVEQGAPETPVTGPTLNKRVVLTIASPRLPDHSALVTLERVITYDPVKADRDHEALCGAVNGEDNLDDCLAGYAAG